MESLKGHLLVQEHSKEHFVKYLQNKLFRKMMNISKIFRSLVNVAGAKTVTEQRRN